MKAIFYTAAYIGLPFLYLARAHHALYGILSPVQLALSLFLLINILICTWEMTLFLSRKLIRSQFEGYTKKFGKNVMPSPIFLFEEVSFSDAIGMEYWSRVWSTYSTLDPSYSDQTTFGFFVDVGNGFTTILPSIYLVLAMTFNLPEPFALSARNAGLLSIIFFWQELYGTIIYFTSFIVNQRYEGKKIWQLLVVLISNGIWMVGPGLGMWCCWRMVEENRWDVFRK